MNKRKQIASIRRKKPLPVRGRTGLTRGKAVSVRSPSGLTHPLPGKLGRELAER
jgi:hypothetical protein